MKKISVFAVAACLALQPAHAFQKNDGTGSNWNNGSRNGGFCSTNFDMPFGFVFRPCLYFSDWAFH